MGSGEAGLSRIRSLANCRNQHSLRPFSEDKLLTLALRTPSSVSYLRSSSALLSRIRARRSITIVVIALIILVNTPLPPPRNLRLSIDIAIITVIALIQILRGIHHVPILHAIGSLCVVAIPAIVAFVLQVFALILPAGWICRRLTSMMSRESLTVRLG